LALKFSPHLHDKEKLSARQRYDNVKDIFLSYHYDDPNTRLARQVEDLLESHSLRATTGDVLAGGVLTEEIKKQIGEADGLIALVTRNQELAGGKWISYPYVHNELQHARGLTKPAIALVEAGVDVTGLYKENEYIPYSPADALTAFLKLSRTVWRWKLRAGRILKLQLLPEALATELWKNRNQVASWEYRLSSGLRQTEWEKARPEKEPHGLFLYVRVPDDTMLIEVRIVGAGKAWTSDAMQFHTPVSLSEQ
jgi:hypothetical protein